MNVLTINAGSSSIKYKAYVIHGKQLKPLLSGLIEGIGESEGNWHHSKDVKTCEKGCFKNHEQAFTELAHKLKEELQDYPIEGVGHRVVHGGDRYFKPTIITPEVLAEIRALAQLAPIHNPVNALGIQFAQKHFPKAIHVAVFDSGFHHSMPEYVRQYAINRDIAQHYQIKRYGFHGINHEYVAQQAALHLNKKLDDCHFISLHLGNGASSCLIKNGISQDTSMGLTPLAGLVMGTRCGDIDPAIPLYLQQQGMHPKEIDNLLNKQSGLKGIAGENDMRRLIAAESAGDKLAKRAIEMYVYAIQKIIGAYCSQLPDLDALIFTGGVGENATLIREKTLSGLHHLGFHLNSALNEAQDKENCHPISSQGKLVLVIRGDEEAFIAQQVEFMLSPC